jgi:basic membrane lipoprotein Med (substrate-binding protein (PBP1-ABC) superfamily)
MYWFHKSQSATKKGAYAPYFLERVKGSSQNLASLTQRHSDGMYFAGMAVAAAATALLAKPRPVDATLVVLVQAQSTAPCEVAIGRAPCTLGNRLKVNPFRFVGIPLPAVAAIATEMVQLVALAGNAAQSAAVGTPPAPTLYTQ